MQVAYMNGVTMCDSLMINIADQTSSTAKNSVAQEHKLSSNYTHQHTAQVSKGESANFIALDIRLKTDLSELKTFKDKQNFTCPPYSYF
jgi:hypothetical protein